MQKYTLFTVLYTGQVHLTMYAVVKLGQHPNSLTAEMVNECQEPKRPLDAVGGPRCFTARGLAFRRARERPTRDRKRREKQTTTANCFNLHIFPHKAQMSNRDREFMCESRGTGDVLGD